MGSDKAFNEWLGVSNVFPSAAIVQIWVLIIMRWKVYHLARYVGKVVRFQHWGNHWRAAPLYQKQANQSRLSSWLWDIFYLSYVFKYYLRVNKNRCWFTEPLDWKFMSPTPIVIIVNLVTFTVPKYALHTWSSILEHHFWRMHAVSRLRSVWVVVFQHSEHFTLGVNVKMYYSSLYQSSSGVLKLKIAGSFGLMGTRDHVPCVYPLSIFVLIP